jgi:hypothetical protein
VYRTKQIIKSFFDSSEGRFDNEGKVHSKGKLFSVSQAMSMMAGFKAKALSAWSEMWGQPLGETGENQP